MRFWVIILVVVLLWIANAIEFSKCDFESPYKCEVMHGIGIVVAPLGWVFGFIDFGK